MTLKEMLDKKYRDWLKTMNRTAWESCKRGASERKQHIAEYMYMCLEITDADIKQNGGYNSDLYREIKEAHAQKLLASNCHRQGSGHVNKWWLTKKGLKALDILDDDRTSRKSR